MFEYAKPKLFWMNFSGLEYWKIYPIKDEGDSLVAFSIIK